MPNFTLTIDCDNAAFYDDEEGYFSPEREIRRLLEETADRVGDGQRDGSFRDVNGNTVGSFVLNA